MIQLNHFDIKKVKEEGNKADFEVGPLPKGYGDTLGNIIRRILLSSIPGAAITAVKIDGVQHEYSTLEGLSDDVLAIVLSVKNIVIASRSEEPVKVSINVKGQSGKVVEVLASDIEKDSDIDVINGEYVITKLTKANAKFKAEFTVERGTGYLLPQEDKRREVDVIPVDARFSPVTLVSYKITSTRVGQKTDYDQLNLSVTTNGSITPVEVLNVAANILNEMSSHFNLCAENMLQGKSTIPELNRPIIAEEISSADAPVSDRKMPVKELNLSTRLTNGLLRAGYEDLMELEGMAEEEIINIRGLGSKSVDELLSVLKENNIKIL